MATIREKSPGVWEVRIFTGRDTRGRPTQISRTVRGGKRDAQRLAIDLEGGPGEIALRCAALPLELDREQARRCRERCSRRRPTVRMPPWVAARDACAMGVAVDALTHRAAA